MGRFTTAAKVGVFVVATTAAAFAIVHFIGGGRWLGQDYVVYALFNDAMGIAKHSRVESCGVPIGHIEGVRLDQGKARIDIRIKSEIPVYSDATVAKVSSSLLGEYVLRIAPGTEGRDQLKDGDPIQVAVEAVTMDQLMNDLGGISEDVKRVSKAVSESVGTKLGKGSIQETLKHLAEVTQALNQTVRTNRETIHTVLLRLESTSTKGEPEVRRILEDVRNSTTNIRLMLARPEHNPNEDVGKVRKILDRVDHAGGSLESTLSHADSVAGRIDRGEGTVGRLIQDEKVINEIEGATQNLGDYLGGMSRLQTIVNLREDYQFLEGSMKSYIQLRLQPRDDKYYSFEVVFDPRGNSATQQVAVETTNPNEPPVYFEQRTVTTGAPRFSLQFAQRFGPFWGRFGIKESTGGVGLDALLLNDRLELSQDLYGFGELVLPRWRLNLGYEFLRHLWMLAGADDVLSRSRRDYFVGFQLRFNDEDLKTILPFAP